MAILMPFENTTINLIELLSRGFRERKKKQDNGHMDFASHGEVCCSPTILYTADDRGPDCSLHKRESFKDEKTFV